MSSTEARGAVKKLPTEIVRECLRHLPTVEAKSARLVCRLWSDIIAHWLFQRIYFRPHPEIMDIFEKITSNQLYALGVNELICDARMFADCPIKTLEKWKYNFRLCREQQDNLDQGADLQHLVSGLEKIPNLKSVRVLEDFDSGATCIKTGKTNNFKYYENWCQKLRKTFNDRPQPWAPVQIRATTQLWDARGVEHLFQALAMRSPQLSHFGYGSNDLGLSLKLMITALSSTLFENLARSLTCLSIVDYTSELISVPDKSEYLPLLAKSIKHAQKLKFLSLELRDLPGMDWDTVFAGASWPNLSSLALWNWHFHPDALKALCHTHKGTLQQLSLIDVVLESSDTGTSWEDVCQELGQVLRLHYIRIDRSDDAAGYDIAAPLSSKRTEGLLRQIMRWVPEGMLEEEDECNAMRLRTSSLRLPVGINSEGVCGCVT